ncbi:39S ribosomal protein L50, mitochondrial [Schistocerca americana]|uniref:39S ribosomal protein L50, mitochondrial n=1 Tax=Schistocerca americana TaxID=7009 RepID=UPI001F4FB93A|nr:39S ribosomal protein L50, mitochondrial [Schistocerca americana]XP_047119013.1 39S ribosomal protein L50, mitochondrial [Schistocerca piceifrons]
MADGKQQAQRLCDFYWLVMVTWYTCNCIMAALARHGLMKGDEIKYSFGNVMCIFTASKKLLASKNKKKEGPRARTIESTGESLASRGFVRPQKQYIPEGDIKKKIDDICKSVWQDKKQILKHSNPIADSEFKFSLLAKCYQEFQHGVPNSLLHTIESLDDVINFYETPVDVTIPFDTLKKVELPENLHIQYEYHRFHPETDTMFGGVSAFPLSSTIVTGLRYKKKYKGHIAKPKWM